MEWGQASKPRGLHSPLTEGTPMSTEDTQRNSNQGKQGRNANPPPTTHSQPRHSDGTGTPLPFDDDDTGGTGSSSSAGDPQSPPIEQEF